VKSASCFSTVLNVLVKNEEIVICSQDDRLSGQTGKQTGKLKTQDGVFYAGNASSEGMPITLRLQLGAALAGGACLSVLWEKLVVAGLLAE
jgi:hypothetical protein